MSKYWNPYLETLEPQKIKHLQLLRFKEAFVDGIWCQANFSGLKQPILLLKVFQVH